MRTGASAQRLANVLAQGRGGVSSLGWPILALLLLLPLPRLATARAGAKAGGAAVETPQASREKVAWGRAKAAPGQRWAPTSVGGFLLPRGRFALTLQLGYPHSELSLSYGILGWLQLEVGYQGFASNIHGGWAGLRFGIYRSRGDRTAMALRARGGYGALVKNHWGVYASRFQAGGDGGFGELTLLFTLRGSRHAFLMSAGAKLSQVSDEGECAGDFWCLQEDIFTRSGGLPVTGLVEFGWEFRVTRRASFFLTLGMDVFPNGQLYIPVMVRSRLGVILEF